MKPLHIAVGVVSDAGGRILISERKPDCAYAGQWEFPGGKCEPGEPVTAALARELREELSLTVRAARPLIRLEHRYPDRHVLLDTWRVTAWEGVPEARENQRFAWVPATELDRYPMLAANRPIVRAVQLPETYLITPAPGRDRDAFVAALAHSLAAGVRLVRLRAPALAVDDYAALASRCLAACRQEGARLLLDRDPGLVERLGADGLHLDARTAARLRARPLAAGRLFAVSCHDGTELEQALALDADFAVLGPLAATPSHPGQAGIGWSAFVRLVGERPLPVYGIGGLQPQDLDTAWRHRAQGIAAIRGLWRPAMG
ncbi:MAG TPA: Nudix family hydrolase [Nevskiales bacterium]|nr:Nudix family hydrolase [Nevskiales bacterium]